MPSEDVAIALGHQDGRSLVRRLYGHREPRARPDRRAHATRAENRGHTDQWAGTLSSSVRSSSLGQPSKTAS